jgi:hypothetical protein
MYEVYRKANEVADEAKALEVKWMLAVLANDEATSDEEIKALFLAEGVAPAVADFHIARRAIYMNGAA